MDYILPIEEDNLPKENLRRVFHEVHVTKDLRSKERTEALVAFAKKHIADFKGETGEGYPIPRMLFERPENAHAFANELSARLDIPREHVTVKPQKQTDDHRKE